MFRIFVLKSIAAFLHSQRTLKKTFECNKRNNKNKPKTKTHKFMGS